MKNVYKRNIYSHLIYKANIDKLIALFPKVFDKEDPLPLAGDIVEALRLIPNLGIDEEDIYHVITCWTARAEYCRAMVNYGWRFSLAGKKIEPIDFDKLDYQLHRLNRFKEQGRQL